MPFLQRLSAPAFLAVAFGGAALFARSSLDRDALRPPRVYVTCEKAQALAIIDSGADEVVATVPLEGRARGVRVAPDGRVLVAVSRSPETRNRDAVLVVDPVKNRVVSRFDAGSEPENLALAAGKVYVSNEDAGTLTVLSLSDGRRLASLPVGNDPAGVAATPDGSLVLATSESDDSVTFVTTRNDRAVGKVKVPGRPRGVAFTPDGARAFVTCENGHSVAVVDVRRQRLAGSVELEESDRPAGVVLSADGSRLFVSTAGALRAFDRRTLDPRGSLGVDGRPWGVAPTPDGRKIYTASGLLNSVAVVDTSTFGLVKTIGLGEGPWGVAIAP